MNTQELIERVSNLQQAAHTFQNSDVANDASFSGMIRVAINIGAVTVERVLDTFKASAGDWIECKNLPSHSDRKIIQEWILGHINVVIRTTIYQEV